MKIAATIFALLLVVFPFFGVALRWPARIIILLSFLYIVFFLLRKAANLSRNRLLIVVFVLCFWYACLELFSLVALRFLPTKAAFSSFSFSEKQRSSLRKLIAGKKKYIQFDSELGWSINPSFTYTSNQSLPEHQIDLGGARTREVNYTANSDGFRALREYEKNVPSGIKRAICFGDSFTHCSKVDDRETWQYAAETLSAAEDEPWQLLNFGVGGHGLTQAYLRFLRYREKYQADVVIIGFMSNNIERSVSCFRPFVQSRTGAPLAIPFARLGAEGDLQIKANPAPDLGVYSKALESKKSEREFVNRLAALELTTPIDKIHATPFVRLCAHLYRRFDGDEYFSRLFSCDIDLASWKEDIYHKDSHAFLIVSKLFEKFVEDTRATGAKPLILFFPNIADLKRSNEGKKKRYRSMLNFFRENELPYVDVHDWLTEEFLKKQKLDKFPNQLIIHDGHFTPPVNKLVGERLLRYLQANY